MSLEESFSEIERRLRNLESLTNTQDSSQINYGVITTPTDWFLEGEWIWIKLTAKQATSGQYFYGWKQMLRLVDPTGGYIWVESGKEGSVNEFPAIALNNDNLSVTDGRRYPARWNPDTYQWIFFLRLGSTTPTTDWPAGPYSCYFTLASLSISYPGTSVNPGCKQTSYYYTAFSCTLNPADFPIASIKVWVTWEGIEKLMVYETPQVVPTQFGQTINLKAETGYYGFYDNILFPYPPSGSVGIRWEVTLNNSIDALYQFGLGPRNIYYNDCGTDIPPNKFLNPDSVSVTGANLTGSSSTDCFFRQVNPGIQVSSTALAGPIGPSGPVGGFRVEITDMTFAGSVSWPDDINPDQIDLQSEFQRLKSLFNGAFWRIGQSSSTDCEENTLISQDYSSTVNRVINQIQETYYLMTLVEQPAASNIGGVTDSLIIDRSLATDCAGDNDPNIDYLASLPLAKVRWRGNSLNVYVYASQQSENNQSRPVGTIETLFPVMGGNPLEGKIIPLTSYDCQVPSGWTYTWTKQYNFFSTKVQFVGGTTSTVLAKATGATNVTFKITYLL